ncbi:hypothetical protein [Piscinibacter sp. HJYY11]|uniref:hypothetical protein n=1 Tax=Piscinibacter sp. HJYY11 TaxID=2801333 RepID=UPI00191CC065|nr:hypothetical protein [Piscinibacter sp. HJYY11]MBL0729595.1 hypothetical protein [Piscinibacter sp. HJYY11]
MLVRSDRVELMAVVRGKSIETIAEVALDGVDREALPDAISRLEPLVKADLGDTRSVRGPLIVLLSARWAPAIACPWSRQLQHAAPARRYLSELFTSSGVTVADTDEIRIEDRGYKVTAVAVLYRADVLAAVAKLSDALHCPLKVVMTLQQTVWQVFSSSKLRALALVDGQHVSMIKPGQRNAWMPGQVCFSAPNDSPLDTAARLIRRLALRTVRSVRTQVRLIDLGSADPVDSVTHTFEAPRMKSPLQGGDTQVLARLLFHATGGSAHRPLSVMPVATRTTRMQIGMASVALTCASIALLTVYRAQAEVDGHASLPPARVQATGLETSRVAPVADPARVRAVNAAIRELNLPFEDLSRSLTPPRDIHVGLLSLSFSSVGAAGQRSAVLLTADARSSVDMTRYVAFLADRPTVQKPSLVAHQLMEGEPGTPYRFSVELSWRD